MKNRIYIFVPIVVFVVCFIIGSINNIDLAINQTIYSEGNLFGLIFAAIGMFPGYGCLAFLGGALFVLAFKGKEMKMIFKVLCYFFSFGLAAFTIYYGGKEIISVNAFNVPDKWYIGYPISLVTMGLFYYWGFVTVKNNYNPRLWILILIMGIVAFLALVPGVTLIKIILHRPRFRYVVNSGLVEYHNWWERCSEYKDYLGQIVNGLKVTSEEFKSCPSGHTACSALAMMFFAYLPLFYNKGEKYQHLFFFGGMAWCFIVAFTRMLIGAHYLTDVSLGGLIFMLFFVIGNEFVLRYYLKEKKEKI